MSSIPNIERVLSAAPRVTCPRCAIRMTMRVLDPSKREHWYAATFRCPQCGDDVKREFECVREASV